MNNIEVYNELKVPMTVYVPTETAAFVNQLNIKIYA